MKKKMLAALLVSTLCLSLTACGGETPSTVAEPTPSASGTEAAKPATKELNIKVILNTTASEYWGYVVAGANGYAAEHPEVKVDVVGPTSETAYDEQMNMIETVVSSGQYDGMVISALQPDMVANKIAGTKLPIVAVNSVLEAPEVLSFVGTSNYDAAKTGGTAAVEAAKAAGWGEVKGIAIGGVQGDVTGQQRLEGFKDGINDAGGEYLEKEIQYADSLADKAVASMEAIMQTHPEGIAIIICHNDDMAIAAARAAKGNPAYAKTIFCGFDGIQSACNAIIIGDETMSIAQDAYGMGYKSVEACVKAIGGEKIEARIDTGCEIITKDNAQNRLDTLKGYLK